MIDMKEAKVVLKDLKSTDSAVAVKAAERVLEEVAPKVLKSKVSKEPKTITVNLSSVRPEVTFTGDGWCAMDIKLSYAAIVRKFKENQRELYRKEYEKK